MPRILVYNPTCEMAVQNDTVNYQPPRQLCQFESDMASIMMFLSEKDDVIVADRPDEDIVNYWHDKGLTTGQFVDIAEARRLFKRGDYTLCPWGWSKEVFYRIGGRELANRFTNEHRSLLSRASSVALDEELAGLDLPDIFVQSKRPRLIRDAEELKELLSRGPCVLKSLWSASGRGVSIVDKEEYIVAATKRYSANIKSDGAIVWEPLLSRVEDFALLFNIDEKGNVDYLGKNYYRSDPSGRFGKELIGMDPMAEHVEKGEIPRDWEETSAQALSRAIGGMGWESLYQGPIGVDAMLYSENGRMKIRLCIEANMRHTMGNINLSVRNLLGDGTTAEWSIGRPDGEESFRLCKIAYGKIMATV